MAVKKSTTPKSDALHAQWAAWDKLCDFVSVTEIEYHKAKCKMCGGRFKHVMSAYAVSKDANDVLKSCGCGRKMIWFKRIEK